MSGTPVWTPRFVRLRAHWEARAKRGVGLTLHHLRLLKPLSFVQWLADEITTEVLDTVEHVYFQP